ncbi:hypothetical protein GCM10028815_03040 [Mariniluteicoccus flavus]
MADQPDKNEAKPPKEVLEAMLRILEKEKAGPNPTCPTCGQRLPEGKG